MESLPTARLLVLVNYRPGYSHGWGSKTCYRQVRIDPLSPASAEQLLETLLGDDPSTVPLRALLIARTESNPFFLEESVQNLAEIGALAGDRGAYRLVRAVETVQIPATAQTILAARIDRLSPEDKRLLQTAAVIGKNIPYSLFRKIAETDEPALREGLVRLQASEFLYEVQLFPEAEYTFKHALTQEVAYHSLLQERRRSLHSRILEAMEVLYADRLSERVERLAHHAFQGAVWEKAVMYLRQAGRRALDRSTSRDAGAFFEQALGALQHLPERRETIEQAIDVRLDLRLALVPLNEYELIVNHLQAAEMLARSLDDRGRLAWIAYGMAHYHYISHDQERAVEAGQRAITLGGGADFALQIAVNMVLGYALHTMGEFGEAIRILRMNIEALRGDLVREQFGLPAVPAVTCRERLIRCLAEIGEFSEGIERGEEGLALAEELDHPMSLTQMYLGLGHLYLRKGDLARAIPVLERGMALGRQWNISLLLPTLISAVDHARVLLGRLAEGLPLLEEGFKLADSRGRTLGHPLRMLWLAEGYLLKGQAATALEHATRALQLSRDHKEIALHGWALQVLGEIAAADKSPDVSGAERFYGEAIELAEGRSMRPLLAHCRLGLGKLYRRAGQRERAQEHLTIATGMFREMDMRLWLEQAEAEMRELA